MAANLKKINKKTKAKKSDVVFFKLSSMFFLACALIIFIMKLSHPGVSGNLGIWFWRLCRNPVYLGVLTFIFVLSLGFFLYQKLIAKADESLRYIASVNFVALGAYALVASFLYGRIDNPVRPLLICTVCLFVLYFIYYLYQADFFIFSAVNFGFCVVLWLFAGKTSPIFMLTKAAIVIASAALCLYLFGLATEKNTKSKTRKKGTRTRLFSLWPVFISAVLFAGLMFSPHFFMLTTVQIMIIMLIQFLLAGIYYTVKLIREV